MLTITENMKHILWSALVVLLATAAMVNTSVYIVRTFQYG